MTTTHRITTTSTGIIKPGLHGTATPSGTATVYLGPDYVKTEIPLYTVRIDGSAGEFTNCQHGRDFTFSNN
jgi:hypothetical protein